MAFQQSTQQAAQRISRPGVGGSQNASGARSPDEQPLELSRTWVLFSPPTEVTATSYLTETERSIQTPGRSRLSDLGSLNTGAEAAPASAVLVAEESQLAEESLVDDAELDSLDGHLPGFRSLPSRNQHIFPSHDGLGSFRLDQPALGPEAQDQLYEFERFNPRRVRRRLNSFEQAQFDLEEAQAQEADKRQRIENWRLEHSKILLEEIQRETRCRQRLKASLRRTQQARQADADSDADLDNMDWHEQEAAAAAAAALPQEEVAEEEQSFLERITRVALRDLLDIDDGLLSILFGEEMVSEEELTAEAQRAAMSIESTTHDSWQIRMLERVSTELGLLVNQLSRHPGAFSTYNRVQQAPPPFAGLPVIPEAVPAEGRTTARATAAARAGAGMATPTTTTLSFAEEGFGEADFPGFRPTMAAAPSPGSRGVLSRKSSSSDSGNNLKEATAIGGSTFTQEEWERDVDIKLVFRYLVSRFTSGPEAMVSRCDAAAEPPRHHHHNTMSKGQDPAAAAANKAGRLRYHPLISRPRPADRRVGSGMGMGMVGGGVMSPMAIRHHSSCASQSTRRSARRSSGGSSRHYWDIGGSIKTGSVIASNGAMGTWGEG